MRNYARTVRDALGSGRRRELEQLSARVAELEAEVRECRRHQHRLAELTDVVEALLVPLADRDEAKVREALARYSDQLG
jgi:hypothetical protein